MLKCPYTNSLNLVVTDDGNARVRPANIQILKCQVTGFYSALHQNGKVYPLEDRLNPESDVINKIIDE